MAAELVFRPVVKQEADQIISWYEKQKKGLGLLLLEVLDMLLKRIQSHPLQFPEVHKHIRKATLKDFPFNVYFRVHKNQVVILAILHQKRNPKTWKGRK